MKRIVFVDNDPNVRQLWYDQCMEAGLKDITIHAHASTALGTIERFGPDIAVFVCDGEIPMMYAGAPSALFGRMVLHAAYDVGIKHRIVVSNNADFCKDCAIGGLATHSSSKEDVVELVLKLMKADRDA